MSRFPSLLQMIPALLCLLLASARLVGLEVQLRDQAVIARDQVVLADIAELQGDPQMVATAGTLPVRRLLDMADYRIDGAEVSRLLRRHLGREVTVSGHVAVRRASETITAEMLNEAAIAHLNGRSGDRQVEVSLRRAATPQILAADDRFTTEIVAEPLTDSWWGDVPYRLRLLRDGQEVARSLAILEVHAWREVPVTLNPISRGAQVSMQDVALQRVRVAPGSGDHDWTVEDVVGMVAQRFIPPATTLGPNWVQPRPAVTQGDVVMLVYDGGGFTLSVHAEALNAGAIGERIRVRVGQGTPIEVRVHSPGEVRLMQGG